MTTPALKDGVILIPDDIEKMNFFDIEMRFFENKETQAISTYAIKRIGERFSWGFLKGIDAGDLGVIECLYPWQEETAYGVEVNVEKFTKGLKNNHQELSYSEILMSRLNIDYEQVQAETEVKELVAMKRDDEYLVLAAYDTKIITYKGILHSDAIANADEVLSNPYEFSIFEKNQIIGKVRENIDNDIPYYLSKGYLLVTDKLPTAIKHADIVFEQQSAFYEKLISTGCTLMQIKNLCGQRLSFFKGDEITENWIYTNDDEGASIVFIEGDLVVENLVFKTVNDAETDVFVSGDVRLNYFIQENENIHLHVAGDFVVKEAIFNFSHYNSFLKNRDIGYLFAKEESEQNIPFSAFHEELISSNSKGENELNGELIADYVLSGKSMFKESFDIKEFLRAAREAYEKLMKELLSSEEASPTPENESPTLSDNSEKEKSDDSTVSKDSYLYSANTTEHEATKRQSKAKLEFLEKHNLRMVSYAEALELLKVDILFDDFRGDDDDWEEPYADGGDDVDYIYYADTDVHIEGDFKAFYMGALIIVKGDLTVTGYMGSDYYVTGDASFGTLNMDDCQICLGKEQVRYVQYELAEDHECINLGRPREVNAPYFFSWFYDLNAYRFSPSTHIFALYDWDELGKYQTDSPLFTWHKYVFSMKPEFYYPVEEFWHDAFGLKIDEIHEALIHKKPLFIDGFNPACMPYYNKAELLAKEGDIEQAFLYYKKTIDMSPSFYPAYEDAGRCLLRAGAYKQAKLYFDQGVELMPAHNRDPDFYCAVYSGLVSVLNDDYQAALSLAELALERNAKTPLAQRLKGEALIHLGRLDEAEKALLLALEDNTWSVLANWLLGLVYFLQDKTKQSKGYYETAKNRDDRLLPYTETRSLSHYYAPAKTVDWPDINLETYEPKQNNPEYWLSYFDRCKDNSSSIEMADNIERIPVEFRSLDMLEYLLSTHTDDGAQKTSHGWSIKYFWHLDLSKEIILNALNSENSCSIQSIPDDLIDKEILLSSSELAIEEIPAHLMDYEMCLHAASCCDGYNYEQIPNEFKDERMAAVAISCGALQIDSFPTKYTGHAQLKAAIDLGLEALNYFPAKYVDTTIFNYAQEKYGDSEAWKELVKNNSPEFNDDDSKLFEQVWAHFWNEELILKAVDKDAGIYGLNESFMTQEIANLAVARDEYNFEYIPEKYIHQELCLLACSKGYGSALEFVPLSMRTKKVCEASVSCDPANLVFVPLEYRTEELCKKSFLNDSSTLKFIPYEYHFDIFDELIKESDDDYYKSYLLVSRGIAYLYQNKLDEAVSDFIQARQIEDELTDEDEQTSFYYQGLAYYRLGDSEKAQACYQKSQELDSKETGLTLPYSDAELPPISST